MVRYFTQDGNIWRVNDTLRNMVRFQPLNLLEDYAMLGTFDIIFCRNVLIYFNNETKSGVLQKIGPRLAQDGLLFLGACETILNLPVPFEGVQGHHGILRHKTQPAMTTAPAAPVRR